MKTKAPLKRQIARGAIIKLNTHGLDCICTTYATIADTMRHLIVQERGMRMNLSILEICILVMYATLILSLKTDSIRKRECAKIA